MEHFAQANLVAYRGPRGPVVIMDCPTGAVAKREAARLNANERAAALAARLRINDVHPIDVQRRPRERMYGPEFGDYAD